VITETGDILSVGLEQTAPVALSYDKRMVALTKALAKTLQNNATLVQESVGIYYQIEKLGDRMLDILAADMHVDWYKYDWPISKKRFAIQNSIAIHRKMGTVRGLRTALENVAGDVAVAEWFDYDGEPYRFRVAVNLSDENSNLSAAELMNVINVYKPARAKLEDDAIVWRVAREIFFGSVGKGITYWIPKAGELPKNAVIAGLGTSDVSIKSENRAVTTTLQGTTYELPKCGEVI
jgi:phage tail P2-like protein